MSNIKKCYLDANVLVYFKDISSDYHQKSISLIEELVSSKFEIYISALCLDEFLYASLVYLRKVSPTNLIDQLKNFLESILEITDIRLINPPLNKQSQVKVIEFMDIFSLDPRDAYHLFIMLSNKIKYFATFDQDFKKVFKKGLLTKFV